VSLSLEVQFSLRAIPRFALFICLFAPLGCSVRMTDPAASTNHPANPHAAESPPLERSQVLLIQESTSQTFPASRPTDSN